MTTSTLRRLDGIARSSICSAIAENGMAGARCSLAGAVTSTKIGLLGVRAACYATQMHLYGQYCPIARAAEILADRWTVLIIRELLSDINQFNELERGLPHVSRTLLTERLRRLERTGILMRRVAPRGKPTEYRLTQAGYELQKIIDVFGEWGARWAFGDPRPNELDPIVLLWWMRRRVCVEALGKRRVVIEFNFGR